MTHVLPRGIAFLLGFGFSFVPTVGPFFALAFYLSRRWRIVRSDAVWGLSALLLGLPLALAGNLASFSGTLFQLGAAWLLYRAFMGLHRTHPSLEERKLVAIGLISGLLAVVALGWFQLDALNLRTAKTIAQAIVWESVPALYGHTVLTLGALIAVLAPSVAFRMSGLALSALGILVSGSREAAIAWVFLAVAFLLFAVPSRRRIRIAEGLMVILMLLIAAGFGPLLGWGRVGFLLDLAPSTTAANLLQGTEIPAGDWWDRMGVRVESGRVRIGEQELTSYQVTKTAPESWRRLQQVVSLTPGESYTLSTWLELPTDGVRPGMQGWGQLPGSEAAFIVSGSIRDGAWRAGKVGNGRILDTGLEPAENGWARAWITFVYQGEEPISWWVGLTPDQRDTVGTSTTFAGFQLERSKQLGSYQPGSATHGLSLQTARLPYWQAAWIGIAQRPLFGWGEGRFSSFFQETWTRQRQLQEVPAHTHNLFLQILFERGLVGLVGLLLLLGALCWRAVRNRDLAFLTVLGAVLMPNLFDYTLFYGGVLYPLAAIAGWRAATTHPQRAVGNEGSKLLAIRLVLAVTDVAAALLALLAAVWLRGVFGSVLGLAAAPVAIGQALLLALLLWPAMSWREGLYPGYGLTAPQELRKQVIAASYAGLIFAAGTVLFTRALPLPRGVLLLMVALGFVLLPLGRAVAKRLLYALGLWGRPVVILGAGKVGQRVARALLRTPLDGLQPLAFFDDDPALHGKRIYGLRVRGSLTDADAFAARHGIGHAIVAIPSLSSEKLASLIDRKGRRFKRVQFVPNLAGLPAEDVFASSLDGMLAIEVYKGLYARRNRLFKRAIDLLGSSLLLVLLAPLLLLLYLLVRLDSRGPGFYRSERVGQHGKIFRCLKFRTMFVDADERLERMLAHDPAVREEYSRFHKLVHDPRVTRMGRWLRKYSLDELPQLINVFRGEMSLVGPRPYLTRELAQMQQFGEIIFEAKPGMTGYWQVSGRNDVTFEDRLTMEAHYVRNWSIWWDIIILVRTPEAVLRRQGAR